MSEQAGLLSGPSSLSGQGESLPDKGRIHRAFEQEERDGQHLAIRGRTLALLTIAVLLCFIAPFPFVLYYHALLAAFILIGLFDAWLSRRGLSRPWHDYAFAVADFALLSFTLVYPNPFSEDVFPPQLNLQAGNFVYFFVMLCGLAFSFRPLVMFWGGVAGAIAWSAGVFWVAIQPDSRTDIPEGLTPQEEVAFTLSPSFVNLENHLVEIVVFLIVAGLLATIVSRSRRLVLRQVVSERERGNLARHFAPNMVDRLAQMDSPLTQVREQQVAVLFADVVDFTRWSESRSPSEVIAFLRQVHGRLEQAIFEHGGTLDKFIGDGVMATFGTPETGSDDAANALRSLNSILVSFDDWNAQRATQGEGPVQISVGLHFGTVVMGDIGTERRLEFAVLGDTVNVASRLERLTRDLDCRAVVSDAVVQASRNGTTGEASFMEGLTHRTDKELRGRQESVAVWTL